MELSSQVLQGSSEPPARSGFGPRGGVRTRMTMGVLLAESASPSQVDVATLTGPPQRDRDADYQQETLVLGPWPAKKWP